jgi:uncharacterized protein DUF6445
LHLAPHPNFSVRQLAIGRESAPLLVIDNVVANPDELVELAASKHFGDGGAYYPGVRARAPLTYQQYVLEQLGGLFIERFNLPGHRLRFTMCQFSLVTTPPAKLEHLQRIPHIDSVSGNELAFIHYLFKGDLGGTAFYRHRRTGFEVIDLARREQYFACVEEEGQGPNHPGAAYINGDTALYERVGGERGVFNRMLVYRRNSLHSGSIAPDFVPDPNPRTGRLSINGFLA